MDTKKVIWEAYYWDDWIKTGTWKLKTLFTLQLVIVELRFGNTEIGKTLAIEIRSNMSAIHNPN